MTRQADIQFSFFCPDYKEIFESADFNVIENRGVVIDTAGNRTLDAKVALNTPCPFCGKKHIYHASELACPFGIHKIERRNTHEGP